MKAATKGQALPVPLKAYRGLTAMAGLLTPAWLGYRVRKGKEDPSRLSERRGFASAERPRGTLVWVHGASVGEIISVMPLVERLVERGFSCLLTSGTLTSSRIVARRAPRGVIHQFIPLDAPRFVARFLDHWKPDLALIAESELWPNLLAEIGRRGTPLVMVNARLSQRSAQRWGRLPRSASALLARVDLCLAQTRDDALRFRGLGAPRVEVAGNLKFDVPPPPVDPAALDAMLRHLRDRPVFLAASTHPGEEEAIAQVHLALREEIPGLLTVIVPRHPERGEAVRVIAEQAGLPALSRTSGHMPDEGIEIYVADTIGELGLFYRLAPVVFVGGSLARHGGQNPIEAAKLGAVVLHGPHVWNFGLVYDRLDAEGGAGLVNSADDIIESVLSQYADPTLHARTAEAARRTTAALSGALDRTLSAIEPYLVQLRLGR